MIFQKIGVKKNWHRCQKKLTPHLLQTLDITGFFLFLLSHSLYRLKIPQGMGSIFWETHSKNLHPQQRKSRLLYRRLMAIVISFSLLSLHNFFRLVLDLSPSRQTKSKIRAIGLHKQLYEPNRQIIRSLYFSLSLCLHANVGALPHTPPASLLPKSKGKNFFKH